MHQQTRVFYNRYVHKGMAEGHCTFRKKELLKLNMVTHKDNASTQKMKLGGSGIKVILEYIESQKLAWPT